MDKNGVHDFSKLFRFMSQKYIIINAKISQEIKNRPKNQSVELLVLKCELFKIHIILASYAAVIKLSPFIGFSSKGFFKLLIRRNNAV